MAQIASFVQSFGHGVRRRLFKMTITDVVVCRYCGSKNVVKYGKYNEVQYLWCKDCKRKFTEKDTLFRMKVPINQIATAIGTYYDGLSQNKIAGQLKRIYGTDVSDFAIYNWLERFTKDAINITDYYRPKVGVVWMADETVIDVAGKQYWLLDVIDIKTRFLIASRLSEYRRVEDVQAVMKQAYERTGIIPKVIMTDQLQAYGAIKLVFGNKAKHLQVKKFTDRPNNNIIERMQGTIKARTKIMRDLKSLDTARVLIDGFLVNYNYFRPHETLSEIEPTTPAQKAGIKFPYSGWDSLIRHSSEAISSPRMHFKVPELPEVKLTSKQKQYVYARRHRRKKVEEKRQARTLAGLRMAKQDG